MLGKLSVFGSDISNENEKIIESFGIVQDFLLPNDDSSTFSIRKKEEIVRASNKAVRSFELSLANDKKNPKRLFTYIGSKQSVKQGIAKISSNGIEYSGGKEIADAQNAHFSSVFADEREDE
ncbi:RNA-directed DNA polymerase from mobile element jockey-like, partial [Brachionus plicatilis]